MGSFTQYLANGNGPLWWGELIVGKPGDISMLDQGIIGYIISAPDFKGAVDDQVGEPFMQQIKQFYSSFHDSII